MKNEKRIFAQTRRYMIVCFDSEGQMCNRLWGLLPIISHSYRKSESVVVLFFDHYLRLFPHVGDLHRFHFPRLLPFTRLNQKMAILVRRLLNNSQLRLSKSLDLRSRGCSLVNSWEHRNDGIDLELMPLFRKAFRPSDEVVDVVEDALRMLRNDGSVIVGIHIRRNDYKYFEQGRFYYSDAEYLYFIKQVVDQIQAYGKHVKCLICSDETVNHDAFEGVDTHSLLQASAMHDLYALSRCDCILGPPSTFSQWASFYGQVPLWLVWEKDKPIRLKNFGVCIGLDKTVVSEPERWLS